MGSWEYRAAFLMFLEIAAVAVLLLVLFKIFARTFHNNAVIFITEHFDCFNKKAPSKTTIAACLTAVSYTHLDVYKRQLRILSERFTRHCEMLSIKRSSGN